MGGATNRQVLRWRKLMPPPASSAAITLKPADTELGQYVALQKAQMLEFARLLPEFVAATRWSPNQLANVRVERLRRLVTTAKARSPWHARRLSHIDPTTLTEADVERLPTMTKDDLMTNFDEIVTDPELTRARVDEHLSHLVADAYLNGTDHAVCSGGSSGRRGAFVFDWDGWIAYGLSSARAIELMLSMAPAASVRGAAIIGGSAVHSSVAFAQSFGLWVGKRFSEFHAIPIELPIRSVVEKLNAVQPTCLSGYPSFLRCLCHEVAAGRLTIRPAMIFVGGEALLPEQEQALRRTFDAPIFNFYGCSEASCVAYTCPAGNGLHLCEDTAILEPVDADGRASEPGTTSTRLLVTNLMNPVLPLIRYELDDAVTVSTEHGACACGSSFKKIDRIAGRTEDLFQYGDMFVEPFALQTVIGHEPAVLEYQVRQTSRGAHFLLKSSGPFDDVRLAADLACALENQGLSDPEVTLECVPVIARTGLGKAKRFVALSGA